VRRRAPRRIVAGMTERDHDTLLRRIRDLVRARDEASGIRRAALGIEIERLKTRLADQVRGSAAEQ
jgi:phage regulator Rha-like protein